MNLFLQMLYALKNIALKVLPPSLKSRLERKVRQHINNPAFQSFGQFGEDAYIKKLFESRGIKSGFYIDVGAYSPIMLSNTYVLYRLGWRGVIVDISSETIEQFREIRPKDIAVQKGISSEVGESTFYSWGQSAFNTISEEIALQIDQDSKPVSTTVETTTLADLINDCVPKDKIIDFLSVDVEGHDLKVLQSNDWQKYRPTIICVEDHDFDGSHFNSEIRTFLQQQNYRLISWIAPNLIFENMKQ